MRSPTMANEFPADGLEAAPLPLRHEILNAFEESGIEYSVETTQRADHGRDWWPLSIADVENGHVPHWPGAVVYAKSLTDVVATVEIAQSFKIPITPQGGRSGVVGGAVAPDGGIALDLTGMNEIVDIDVLSGTVTVEAGMFGPDLEEALNAMGFTVGHFPQSFDLATVGGWVACRGAGQLSNRYGKIEDIVRGLTVVTAKGDVLHLGDRGPRQAVGPDLLALFVGSEGTLGVITEVTLVMRPLATFQLPAAYSFSNFASGLEACRRILQRGAHPAVLRLYDHAESKRNFDIDGCALVVLDEGEEVIVRAFMDVVARECHEATELDSEVVSKWLSHRNNVSQLVPLWRGGIIVDTIEIAGPWSALPMIHEAVVSALVGVDGMLGASVHQSHAYLDGACLYFTFAGKAPGDTTDFYREAWDVATKEVLSHGGALSHHHGVGRNRARFVAAALGSAMPLLEGLKTQLDPYSIMNPGALGIGGANW